MISLLTLFIMLNFSIYVDTISMGSSILYFRVHSLKLMNLNIFLSPKIISKQAMLSPVSSRSSKFAYVPF